jgi:hypothetical protein
MLAVNSQGHVGTTGMQYDDGTTWRPLSAPEQPDFGTVAVPDHPGHLMPSPGALHTAFHKAVEELERSRGGEPRRAGYAAKSQEAVFEAGLQAFTNSLRAIYVEGQRGNPNALSFPPEDIPEIQVVASSPGSGKSTREGVHVGGGSRRAEGQIPVGLCVRGAAHRDRR